MWKQTASGKRFDILSPLPEQVVLSDIALSLSRIPRFDGHTLSGCPWNVAEHSVLVVALLPEGTPADLAMAALFHDAHEAYIGDITTPVQVALTELVDDMTGGRTRSKLFSTALSVVKSRIDTAIFSAFGIPYPTPDQAAIIKTADMAALDLERHSFMGPSPEPWEHDKDGKNQAGGMNLLAPAIDSESSQSKFVSAFVTLMNNQHGGPFSIR